MCKVPRPPAPTEAVASLASRFPTDRTQRTYHVALIRFAEVLARETLFWKFLTSFTASVSSVPLQAPPPGVPQPRPLWPPQLFPGSGWACLSGPLASVQRSRVGGWGAGVHSFWCVTSGRLLINAHSFQKRAITVSCSKNMQNSTCHGSGGLAGSSQLVTAATSWLSQVWLCGVLGVPFLGCLLSRPLPTRRLPV